MSHAPLYLSYRRKFMNIQLRFNIDKLFVKFFISCLNRSYKNTVPKISNKLKNAKIAYT